MSLPRVRSNIAPPPASLFAPTAPTFSEDEAEEAEAAEVQRSLSLELTPERLRLRQTVYPEARAQTPTQTLMQISPIRPHDGVQHHDAEGGLPAFDGRERARRVSEWFAGVSPSSGLPSSVSELSFGPGPGSVPSSIATTLTPGDSVSVVGARMAFAEAMAAAAGDDAKSQTSGAGPSKPREQRGRESRSFLRGQERVQA